MGQNMRLEVAPNQQRLCTMQNVLKIFLTTTMYFNQISTSATIFHCVHCRQHKLKLRVGHVSIELLTKVVTKSPRLQN